MVSLVDSERWAPLIGRLFIAFGTVERATHECVRSWSNEAVYKHVKKMPLFGRIELAIDLVASQPFSAENKANFVASLRGAKKLAEYRNIIAHSPLALVLFREQPDTPFREAIASNTDDSRFVEFAELQRVVEQAEASAESVQHNLAAFRVERIDFESLNRFGGLRGSDA